MKYILFLSLFFSWISSSWATPTGLSLHEAVMKTDINGRVHHVQQLPETDGKYHITLEESLWSLGDQQAYVVMGAQKALLYAENQQTASGNMLVFYGLEDGKPADHSYNHFHFHRGLKDRLTWGHFMFQGEQEDITVHPGDFLGKTHITSHHLMFAKDFDKVDAMVRFLEDGQVCTKRTVNKTHIQHKNGLFTLSTRDFINHQIFQVNHGRFLFEEGSKGKESVTRNEKGALIRSDHELQMMGDIGTGAFKKFENHGKIAAKEVLDFKGEEFIQSETGTLFAGFRINGKFEKFSAAGDLLAGYLLSLYAKDSLDFQGGLRDSQKGEVLSKLLFLQSDNHLNLGASSKVRGSHSIFLSGKEKLNSDATITLFDSLEDKFPYYLFYEDASPRGLRGPELRKLVHRYRKDHLTDLPLETAGIHIDKTKNLSLRGQVYFSTGSLDVEAGRARVDAIVSASRLAENPINFKADVLTCDGKMDAYFASFIARQGDFYGDMDLGALSLRGDRISMWGKTSVTQLTTNVSFLGFKESSTTHAEKAFLKNGFVSMSGMQTIRELKTSLNFLFIEKGAQVRTVVTTLRNDATYIEGKAQLNELKIEGGCVVVQESGDLESNRVSGQSEDLSVHGKATFGSTGLQTETFHTFPGSQFESQSGVLDAERAYLQENPKGGVVHSEEMHLDMDNVHVNSQTHYEAKRAYIPRGETTVEGSVKFDYATLDGNSVDVRSTGTAHLGVVDSSVPLWSVQGRAHIDHLNSTTHSVVFDTAPSGNFDITTSILKSAKASIFGKIGLKYFSWNTEQFHIGRGAHLTSSFGELRGRKALIEGRWDSEQISTYMQEFLLARGARTETQLWDSHDSFVKIAADMRADSLLWNGQQFDVEREGHLRSVFGELRGGKALIEGRWDSEKISTYMQEFLLKRGGRVSSKIWDAHGGSVRIAGDMATDHLSTSTQEFLFEQGTRTSLKTWNTKGGSVHIAGDMTVDQLAGHNQEFSVLASGNARAQTAQIQTSCFNVLGSLYTKEGSVDASYGQVQNWTGDRLEGRFNRFHNQGTTKASQSLYLGGHYFTNTGIVGGARETFIDFDDYGSFGQFVNSQQLAARVDTLGSQALTFLDGKNYSNLELISKEVILEEDVHLHNPLKITGDSLTFQGIPQSYTHRHWWGDSHHSYMPQRSLTSDALLSIGTRNGNLVFHNFDVTAQDLITRSANGMHLYSSQLRGTRSFDLFTQGDVDLRRGSRPSALIGGSGVSRVISVPQTDMNGDAIWYNGQPLMTTQWENVGLSGYIGGKLTVQASDILSSGTIALDIEKGLEIAPELIEHVTEKVKTNWKGDETITRSGWTEIIRSSVGSSDGGVYFNVLDGGASLRAVNILGDGKIVVMAADDIIARDAISTHWSSQKKSSFGGLSRTNYYNSTEHSHPGIIWSQHEGIQMISTRGKVGITGTHLVTPAHLSLDALRGVRLGVSTLHHESWEQHQGFSVRPGFMKIYDACNSKSAEEALTHLSPLTAKLMFLKNADNDFNKVSGLVSVGIEAYNMNALYQELGGVGFLGNQAGLLDTKGKLDPSIDFTYTTSTAHQSFTTPGEGSASSGTMTVRSHTGDVEFHALPVNVKETLRVIAPHGIFKQTGFESQYSQSSESQSVGVTVTAVSHKLTGAKVSVSGSEREGTTQIPQVLKAETLDIQAKGYEQQSGVAHLDNITGNVGYIHSESKQDTIEESGFGVSVGVSFEEKGVKPSGSFQINSLSGDRVNQRSGIFVKDGRGKALTVLNTVRAVGSTLDFGQNHVDAEDFVTEKIHDSVTGDFHGVGFSPGIKVDAINLQMGESSYEATQNGSIDGIHLHSRSTGKDYVYEGARGREVHEDKNVKYVVDIPIFAKGKEPEKPQPKKEDRPLYSVYEELAETKSLVVPKRRIREYEEGQKKKEEFYREEPLDLEKSIFYPTENERITRSVTSSEAGYQFTPNLGYSFESKKERIERLANQGDWGLIHNRLTRVEHSVVSGVEEFVLLWGVPDQVKEAERRYQQETRKLMDTGHSLTFSQYSEIAAQSYFDLPALWEGHCNLPLAWATRGAMMTLNVIGEGASWIRHTTEHQVGRVFGPVITHQVLDGVGHALFWIPVAGWAKSGLGVASEVGTGVKMSFLGAPGKIATRIVAGAGDIVPVSFNAKLGKIFEEVRGNFGNYIDAKIRWGKGIMEQGMPYEDYVASQLAAGSRLPPNFKTFDFFDRFTGVATSAKTLDTTTAARISDPEKIYTSLKKNIDDMVKFEEYTLKGKSLTSDMITSRELYVAVPLRTTLAQCQKIEKAMEYARIKGVLIKITKAK